MIKKINKWFCVLLLSQLMMVPAGLTAEIVIYGFEGSHEGWIIPDWAKVSSDYTCRKITPSMRYAEEGEYSLELQAAFTGDGWSGVYVERLMEITDWSDFGRLAVSVYIPPEAPNGLKARVIVTVGEDWDWTEMNHAIVLTPGSWTKIEANLLPGSRDWKFFPTDEFRKDIRKLGVRVESDGSPAYVGSIFMDNIKLSE